MKNNFLLFILLLGLISCREEISLELNSNEDKLVVEGHIGQVFLLI